MGIPRMVLVVAAVAGLDALAVGLLVVEAPTAAALLYHLSTLLGALGGMEALHWMATGSPWAAPGLPSQEAGARARMQAIPWADREWLRSAVLRLQSGGVVAFLALALVFALPLGHLPSWAWLPMLLLLMQFSRLAGPGVSAVLLAPVVLASSPVPPSASDRFHGGLAAGLSALALGLLYLRAGSPPPLDFLVSLGALALNPAHHAYGLLVGGLVWWKVAWVSRWMGRA